MPLFRVHRYNLQTSATLLKIGTGIVLLLFFLFLLADIDVYGLRKQQIELLTLCAVRGMLTTRTRLRKVLMQPPDNASK